MFHQLFVFDSPLVKNQESLVLVAPVTGIERGMGVDNDHVAIDVDVLDVVGKVWKLFDQTCKVGQCTRNSVFYSSIVMSVIGIFVFFFNAVKVVVVRQSLDKVNDELGLFAVGGSPMGFLEAVEIDSW